MKAYYLVTFAFIAFTFVFYLPFRGVMPDYLKRRYGIGKSRWKKLYCGTRGRIWYETLHQQFGVPCIYRLNKLYTLLFALSLLTHLALGWMKIPAVLFCILFSAANIILIMLSAFAYAEMLKAEFGRLWVFFGINHRKGIDSVLFIPIETAMIVLADYTVIREMANLFFS